MLEAVDEEFLPGDRACIVKRCSVMGGSCVILDSASEGRIKVKMEGSGTIQSFHPRELSHPGTSKVLPLRSFPAPPLSQVQADLMFVQAMNAPGKEDAEGRSTSSARSRNRLTQDGFAKLMLEIGARCMAECSAQAALASFVVEVLDPLLVILESTDKDNDVSAAAEVLEDPYGGGTPMPEVLDACKDGLDQLFKMYSRLDMKYGHHWTMQSLTKFSRQFRLGPEFTPRALQRVLSECTRLRPTSVCGSMKLNYDGYRLALIIVSQKFRANEGGSTHDKVRRFLDHLNMIAESTPGLGENPLYKTGSRKLFDLAEFDGEETS